ncbi:MAG: type I restriction endonuclease subunit R [Selenomonadaceae bacterium]|nr:type I restriction endonuclease subunit R [Selenomonadaceae bacterium]
MAELEAAMEKNLIAQLTTGISQWTYRKDITTEEALWHNFREKLNQNNQAVLDGELLTDEEFGQIKNFMLEQAQTPYKAALWLAGENGEAVIPLVREDAAKGTIHLFAVSSREIAGGRSCYEVINQYVSAKEGSGDRERRFDVTLLINGMPMIQIELKNQNHPFMDAFRQIKKYKVQGKFKGLFGLVQMYVVTNGSNTRYIAADTGDRLNENFLTTWVDSSNQPVENYLQFARNVLRIPEAHQMIGFYSVLDAERKKLMLLRPYQIHAIEAVKKASGEGKSGFVWHTTGSGKTMTSYTVTKNLLTIPSVDKTIFLIDRKDLDQQTSTSFKAYAENDAVDIEDTQNIGELVRKLYSNDRIAIITTIQKLQILIKRYSSEAKKDSTKTKKFHGLRIGFVVDECHRTVTPETQRMIMNFFESSLWYGFTGTPIFKENMRARKGDLPRTTEGMFGPCLHKYTIREALHNKAVLGFQIEYKDTISYEQICVIGEQMGVGKKHELLVNEDRSKVTYTVMREVKAQDPDPYANDIHRMEVIDFIINQCAGKFRLSAERGDAYEAILTVKSISDAQCYYRLMKQFVAEGKVAEHVRSKLNDFPRIAITHTVTENDDDSIQNQQFMLEAMQDYNAMFGTNYGLDSQRAYNTDLNDRLARKKGQYRLRENQLDIVIVVDRLLTGFDAPPCGILFVDRPPMSYQNIIQAFSRTNRLYDRSKKYGMIVIFQRAEEYRKAVDDALWLYSNGGTNDVSAPPFAEIEQEFTEAISEIRKLAPAPEAVDNLLNDRAAMAKFVKQFQKLDKSFGEIQVYMEWADKDLERDYGISHQDFDDYLGKYQNVLEELKRSRDDDGDDVTIDIEYELETIRIEIIDYRYLMSLIQRHIPDEDQIIVEAVHDENIEKYIDQLAESNPGLASVIRQFWEDMKAHPEAYKGMDAMNVIEQRIDNIINQQVDMLVKEWCVKKNEVLFVLENYKKSAPIVVGNDYEKFKQTHNMSKLMYKRKVKEAIAALAEKIKPLLDK